MKYLESYIKNYITNSFVGKDAESWTILLRKFTRYIHIYLYINIYKDKYIAHATMSKRQVIEAPTVPNSGTRATDRISKEKKY